MSFYDAYKRAVIGEPTGVIFYGPPRSRKGRFLNRLRRLLSMEERLETYAEYTNTGIDLDADTVKIKFSAAGTFEVKDKDVSS
jgi:hypothetical protein